ncbi:MAG TPA: gliding motility-associated C-terminal domain-containing protein, partial [Cyclobacteriaceae bacterium]|nr:gliding motility-associated C-terminal domain-containing protein [Cyclobacteriaceae bacterium]
ATGFTVKITITAYLNSNSTTQFGEHGQILFGDGSTETMSPVTSTLRPDLGTNISVATYTTTHTYKTAGTYRIMYAEDHRNKGILNITDSGNTAYVSYVDVVLDNTYGCNHFPVLTVPPVDKGCPGSTFYHNAGAYDSDGDSLSYEMTIPYVSTTSQTGYTSPISASFYTGKNYSLANEAGTGAPTFGIDALTGLVTWDAPWMQGEYNIAFKIIEWRKTSAGVYVMLSTTVRDMQIVIADCANTRPDLTIPSDTCVLAGTLLNKTIFGTDKENDPVKIEVYSEILEFDSDKSPATYTPNPAVFMPSNPAAQLVLNWQTECIHVRQQPYQVVFKITDNPTDADAVKLVTYKTWNVKVVAPAPVWKDVVLNVVNKSAILSWEKYSCDNATKIQIWRKVGSYEYTPDNCIVGIPSHSGYILVDEVAATDTTFTDTNFNLGLADGAQYCYRLVALISDTKSYVSTEVCVGPIQTDAPVITHVSVEKTDVEGQIRVSWRSPFNINETQFPKPYQYEIYRANGFVGDTSIVKVSDRVQDTTFLDTPVNSKEKIFNYRIVIYSKPAAASDFIPVDTSAVASSVRLTAIPGTKQIQLAWRDSIPWSNVVQARPYHLIYRGVGNPPEDVLTLYDSVNVIENGFYYTDLGVDENKFYSYKVLTRGTYGNPKIALQNNFSQMVSTYPINNLLPCKPVGFVISPDCAAYVANPETCTASTVTNTLYWDPSYDEDCRSDIQSFNIYATSETDGEYKLISSGKLDTLFIEYDLPSYARCYKISAVDSRGQEGPLSDPICNDNCPFFKLPNVFTPNADGCNDYFSSGYNNLTLTSNDECLAHDPAWCPRFVKSISFKVFNRWGREVYRYHSGGDNSIYINWNGKDNNNNELSTGVYFYEAEVNFDMIKAGAKKKTYKGWVQLLR